MINFLRQLRYLRADTIHFPDQILRIACQLYCFHYNISLEEKEYIPCFFYIFVSLDKFSSPLEEIMLFSSAIFLFWFLPITLIVYFLLPLRSLKNIWLFGVSLFFYAWGEPIFVFVMIASILFNYLMGLGIHYYRSSVKKQRLVLFFMTWINLFVFFVFKYWDFFISNVNTVFQTEFAPLHLGLPIGISFFTFQAMSYVMDVYYDPEHSPVQKNPFRVGLYICLFPQLIAGPIVRYRTVAGEISSRRENLNDISSGIVRFMIGFAKKILIANNMAIISDLIFSQPPQHLSWSFAWLGAVSYTFQIYYDFSAYSDMAIGLGLVFGFHFLENFNHPYIAGSITDFWRRWHISLSTWFRDYVYIPLGGSRKGVGATFRNLFLVWLLTGIWHGASWNFISWGLYYFVFLSLEKFVIGRKRLEKFETSVLARIYVGVVVVCGWVLFRSETLGYALSYLGRMFSFDSSGLSFASTLFYLREYRLFFAGACLFSLPLASFLEGKIKEESLISSALYFGARNIFVAITFYLSVIYLMKGTYNPFIYFNF